MCCNIWYHSQACLLRLHKNYSCFHWNTVKSQAASNLQGLYGKDALPDSVLTFGTIRQSYQILLRECGSDSNNTSSYVFYYLLQKETSRVFCMCSACFLLGTRANLDCCACCSLFHLLGIFIQFYDREAHSFRGVYIHSFRENKTKQNTNIE